MAKNAPFVPMDPRWWLDIAAAMPKPWPREAVYFDLRWWQDQEDRGRENDGGKPVKRPGRYALVKRWGWTHHAASEVLKAEHRWADLYKSGRQETVNEASADRQGAVNDSSENETQGVENIGGVVNDSSSEHQSSVNESSRNRPTRVLSTPIHRSTDPQSTPSSPEGVSPQGDKSEKQEGRHPEPEHGNTPTHPTRHESCEAARTQIPRPDFARAAEARGQYPAEPESGYVSPYRPNLGEGTSPFFERAGRPKPSRHRGVNLTAVQDAPDMMGGVPCFRDVNHAARVTRKGTPEQVLMAQAWMFWRGTLDGEEVIVPEDARLLAEKYAPRWEAYDRRR